MRLLAGLLLFAACSTDAASNRCTLDSQCPVGGQCLADGSCGCKTAEACRPDEFCNVEHICQLKSGCIGNDDCTAIEFCDLRSGDCLPRTACGSDTHCDLGTVCSLQRGSCVQGCNDEADCPLYQVCEKTGTSSTALGRCVSGKYGDRTFCPLGEKCVAGTCRKDAGSANCLACDPGSSAATCGARNFCLINAGFDETNPMGQSPNYCGVECTSSEDCGNGYQCSTIRIITTAQAGGCQNDNECGGGGRECRRSREDDLRGFCTCSDNADCALDAVPPTCAGSCAGLGLVACMQNSDCRGGNCVKQCSNPAGQACTTDAQCQPQPLCAPSPLGGGLACITNGRPCQTSNDCACNAGACVFTGRPCNTGADCRLSCQGGGCILGSGCGPIEGVSCEDLR